MNLERVEELCLNYLKQAPNPLTPVEALLEVCRRDEACRELTLLDLLPFLRVHEQIQVLDGPEGDEPVTAEDFAGAGLVMGARAILKARIPSQREMLELLGAQIRALKEALATAMDALPKGMEDARCAAFTEALARAESLEQQLRRLFPGDPSSN